MQVYLNKITGIEDAITSMLMSKRTWTREQEVEVQRVCDNVLNLNGALSPAASWADTKQFTDWLDTLVKWGWKHTTMLRYIGLSFTVEGLHRGGQDDWDAHAKRYDNRIIRSSTRLANFGTEMSDWYKDKIIPTDTVLETLGIMLPSTIEQNGQIFVKGTNGYVREDLKDNNDAKRGLYMLSIPSNFIFQVNLCEFAHVYKERNINGTANPEVKECCEACVDLIESAHSQFNRELLEKIKN